MIYCDDGFTAEVAPGVLCRPMLREHRKPWNQLYKLSPRRAKQVLQHSPYSLSPWGEHSAAAVQFILGYHKEDEARDFQLLDQSVYLQTRIPGMSTLRCDDCRLYSVNHHTGEIQVDGAGKRKLIPGGCKVPCESHIGCVKGHWSYPIGLSNDRWAMTWNWYWRGAEQIEDCAITRRNRMLLDWIVKYGRDQRFNPFIGSGAGARSSRDGAAKPVPSGED